MSGTTDWIRRVAPLIAMLIALPASSQQAGARQQGIDAYWTLDYDTAVNLLKPLAESGDAESAYYLGLMYDPVSQQINGTNARYHVSFHDRDQALAWYEAAIDDGYLPAYVRGSFLMAARPLSRNATHRSDDFWILPILPAAVESSTFASRLNSGYASMQQNQRQAYRAWHADESGLGPDERFLYLRVLLIGKRRAVYINGVESAEQALLACGADGSHLCYYYLGLIQLDAARNTFSGFDDKHIDAWVNFSLAEQMGNRHAAIHRYVLGEAMTSDEKNQAMALRSQFNQ